MSFPSPFDGPNPWGEKTDQAVNEVDQTPEEPPFEAGVTIKFGAGFDAPWWTPRVTGRTPDEVAKNTVALLKAFVDNGGPEAMVHVAAKAQAVYASQNGNDRGAATAPKTFRNGKVQVQQQPSAPAIDGDSCPHGRTLREGNGQRGPWAALFCNAPKGQQCDPLWRQKDGSFQ